jgi:cobalt-zinc-cadmium efflux system outer membrane protein
MRISILLKSFVALSAGVLVYASTAFAEEPYASAKALLANKPALSRWLEDHQPGMQILTSREREANAATKDARLIQNPVLTVGAAGLTFGHRNPGTLSFTDTPNFQVTFAQTVEIGKRSHRISAAQHHAEAVTNDADYSRGLLIADARESLARIVYLGALRQALQERLKSSLDVFQLDQVRLQHGDVSGIDHNRLELEVLNVQRELADNATDLTDAQAQCATILGATCIGDIDVAGLEDSLPRPNYPVASVFDPSQRSDVKAQRAEAASAFEQAKLFQNRKIPDPQIGLSYLYDRLTYAGNQPHTFGVFVSMPLPLSDYGQHQRVQAEERGKQSEYEARRLELVAKSDAKNLVAAEDLTQRKLELLRTQALPLGSKVLDATESAYRLGQVSLTDLLLARRQRAELMLDLVETYYSLFQVRSQIYRVLGLDGHNQKTP